MVGVAGIWGPSAIACATLAAEEINRAGGLLGREIRLKCFNASDEAEDVAQMTRELVDAGSIKAIVGMHTSSVRRAVVEGCRGRLPYVYTALHEGVERSPGVYTIGETPDRQLQPAIDMFVNQWRARRWMFIGNDYEWPLVSHRLARNYVSRSGGVACSEDYVPFGEEDFDSVLQKIKEIRPDAVLLSLVGQDAINFNRAFGRAGLSSNILRLSCAVEENMLLAIGEDNTDNLFVSSGYFGASTDDANMSFKERYHQRFGQRAPTLNSLGQSNYEGIHFAAALARRALEQDGKNKPFKFQGVRGISWTSNSAISYPVHLARADGHLLRIVKSF
jgi:ABC-type branched-subunit amino acid transport system substrate-binding protein